MTPDSPPRSAQPCGRGIVRESVSGTAWRLTKGRARVLAEWHPMPVRRRAAGDGAGLGGLAGLDYRALPRCPVGEALRREPPL